LQRPCFVLVQLRRTPGRAITHATAIIATIMVTIMPPSRPDVRARGAGGSCAGKSEAIRALHSILQGHGPVTGRAPAVPRSAPSWCGAITSGKLLAMKMVSGSFRAATTATPYGPGPGRSQAPSLSGAPEPEGPAMVGVMTYRRRRRAPAAIRESRFANPEGRLRAAFLPLPPPACDSRL
jgi:hypothetical protein